MDIKRRNNIAALNEWHDNYNGIKQIYAIDWLMNEEM